MKVCELIEILKTYNPDHEVILQKDSEGNGYEKLYTHEAGMFDKKHREFYTLSWSNDSEFVEAYKENAVVLSP